jgi:metal-responsive CopG/Arc/MetJ family transcriptional regulator
MGIMALDRRVVTVRFSEYELSELNEFAQSLGIPSRSRLINLALQELLDAPHDVGLCAKRKVNLLIDPALGRKLKESSERSSTTQAEIIRMALREFRRNRQPQARP